MIDLMKKIEKLQEDKMNLQDIAAIFIAFIQLLYPYVLVSAAVFIILMWLLTTFWLR